MTARITAAAALFALMAAAAPADAQDGWGLAADVGLGAEVEPDWLGSEEMETSPWVILRNVDITRPGQPATADGSAEGLRMLPSFGLRKGRKSDDGDALAGLPDIDRSVEAGFKLRYTRGPASAQLIVRKGFGGHDGLAGSLGARYRIAPNDRLTLWPGVSARFGDDSFTRTFFGVDQGDAAASGYAPYQPDGGFYAVGATIEARYTLTDSLALVAEAEYARLVGDAADAPFVERKAQPSARLGLVHRFNLRF